MMKFTVSVCLGILLCIHVFAVDITGAIHVDTYAGEPVAGISFEALVISPSFRTATTEK